MSTNSSPQVSEEELEIECESGVVDVDDLDPVATEEARAHREEVAREQKQEQEAVRRFNCENDISSW